MLSPLLPRGPVGKEGPGIMFWCRNHTISQSQVTEVNDERQSILIVYTHGLKRGHRQQHRADQEHRSSSNLRTLYKISTRYVKKPVTFTKKHTVQKNLPQCKESQADTMVNAEGHLEWGINRKKKAIG